MDLVSRVERGHRHGGAVVRVAQAARHPQTQEVDGDGSLAAVADREGNQG